MDRRALAVELNGLDRCVHVNDIEHVP